jgi:hypothetical protein
MQLFGLSRITGKTTMLTHGVHHQGDIGLSSLHYFTPFPRYKGTRIYPLMEKASRGKARRDKIATKAERPASSPLRGED